MNERFMASIGAKIKSFQRKMKEVDKTVNRAAMGTDVPIGADTANAKRKMLDLQAIKKALNDKVVIKIEARVDKFRNKMDRIAQTMHSFGTVAGNAFSGGFIATLPSLSPIIGTMVGGAGALASSFTAAFGGLGAFGVAAIGNASKLAKGMESIQKINDKINAEKQSVDPNQEKINELIHERTHALEAMSKEQKSAMKQVNKFKGAWSNFLKVTEKPVFQVFADGLKVATSLLKEIKPIIQPIADVLSILLNRFNAFSQTKQFQSFIDFFATRGSSALESWGTIAGNVFRGFMELMKAFAPLGLDMENGLIGMTEKFSKWAKGLSESKSFEKFINFVKTNAPKVLSLIGNITTFIVNLGIGMAPLGSKISDIVNGFLSWSTEMMKANPLIGQVVAWIISLSGVLLALTPAIVLTKVAFGGMASFIWLKTGMMRAKLVTGISMMIKSLGAFIAKMATTIVKFVAQSVIFIAKWALMGAKATLNAGKMAAAWTLATGKKLAVAAAKMIAQSAMFVAKWVWVGAQSLIQAARVAAAWFIALGPVGWVIATVIALVALIIANWDSVKKWTIKIWKAVWGWIKDTWQKVWSKTKEITSDLVSTVKGKFSDIVSAVKKKMNDAWDKITEIWDDVMTFFEDIDLKQTGKDIIQGLVNGIGAAKDWVITKVKEVAGSIKDTLMFWTDSHSPSKMTEKIGGFVGQGLGNGIIDKIKTVKNAAKNLAKAAIPNVQNFNPNLALADMRASATLDTNINKTDMRGVKHAFSAEMDDFELPDKEDVVLEIDGREVGRATFKHVTEEQKREQSREERFR